jgi:hypothetical protein
VKISLICRSAAGRLKTIPRVCGCLLLAVLLGDVMAVCRRCVGVRASNQLDTASGIAGLLANVLILSGCCVLWVELDLLALVGGIPCQALG